MNAPQWLMLIEGLLESVWIVEPITLKVLAVNHAAEAMLGRVRSDLVGKSVVDLVSTPEDVCFWEDVAAGLTEEIRSHTILRRGDGTVIEVDRQVRPLRMGESTCFVVAIHDRSDQRRVEDALERLVAELRATLESTADGILVTDPAGGIGGYNKRFAALWDLPDELLVRRDDAAIYARMAGAVVDLDGYLERLAVIGRTPLLESVDLVVLRNGRVLERVTRPQYARGRPIGRVFSYRDITQRLAHESELQLAAKVFEASMDAIFITDSQHRLIGANPRCEALSGYSRGELLALGTADLLYEPDGEALLANIEASLSSRGFWEGEVCYRRKDGDKAPGLVSMVRVLDEDSRRANVIGFFRDLSERIAAAKRIEELASSDPLTGLPNRTTLAEHVKYAIARVARDGRGFAILFVDLDRFKAINDSLGHVFGDRVLVEVADRIKSCMRQADTLARLGGDEFVLLVNDADAHGAEAAAKRILNSLREPLSLDDMSFAVSCSIGISLYPEDGANIDDLVKNADTAMYRAKDRGRSGFRFYQRQMNVDLLARMKLDNAMRQALERGEFRLAYQPQVELSSGRIVGAEALLRWTDPSLGEVPPGKMIPVAEETGFIVPLGDWVVQEAVRQARQWRDRGVDVAVAVNVSALQFHQPNFVDSVRGAIKAAGLPPDRLEVELTESILVRDAEETLHRLESLAALGVSMSIDDFGTGYSSLTYLKRFPIQKLKIDRSFVSDLPADESDAAIVCAIINLGRALRLRVIAEGVETDAQREFLLNASCDEFQGYYCAPALSPAEFERVYREKSADHAVVGR